MRTITVLLLIIAFLNSCKGEEKEISEKEGNMGMDFLLDTIESAASYASSSEKDFGKSWQGKYHPIYMLKGDTVVRDIGGAVSFKIADDGKGVYREAKLFGDKRRDYFAFQGNSNDKAVSERFKNWIYWRLNDSMLRDNSGNVFLKAK